MFFSIALIVYHAFFKVLGIALFCIEFGWFIVRPVAREASISWKRRVELHWRKETKRTVLIGAVLFGLLVLPWQPGVTVPAVFGPQQAQGMYAVTAGFLAASPPPARDGQLVRAGEVLGVVVSPDLEARLKAAQADEAVLRWQVEQQAFDDRLREHGVALTRQWEASRQTVTGLQAEIAQLTLRAPFDGALEVPDGALASGTWVLRGEHLFDAIGPAGIKGDAFVDENDVTRVKAGDRASFVASITEVWPLHCTVQAVDKVNMGTLDEPAVSSVYGGPIPAERTRKLIRSFRCKRFGACVSAIAKAADR